LAALDAHASFNCKKRCPGVRCDNSEGIDA
jgi:hypothetical protein